MQFFLAALMPWHIFLAEGINTGNNDNEGWGGLIGVAVVIAAVCLTVMIVRGLERKPSDAEEEDVKFEEPEALRDKHHEEVPQEVGAHHGA